MPIAAAAAGAAGAALASGYRRQSTCGRMMYLKERLCAEVLSVAVSVSFVSSKGSCKTGMVTNRS